MHDHPPLPLFDIALNVSRGVGSGVVLAGEQYAGRAVLIWERWRRG